MAAKAKPPVGSAATAVVAGASMAGLCAARVLAERFEQVIVFDRDSLAGPARWRRQVPQGRHPHLLLVAGARLLEGWFPGLTAELHDAGATDVDLCDIYWYQNGGEFLRVRSDLRGPSMSRPLLEDRIRRRLGLFDNVRISHEEAVTGLVADASGRRITGAETDSGVIGCDLFVDCTGRQARSLSWLAEMGWQAPTTSTVTVDTRYVTRIYRRDRRDCVDWTMAGVIGEPSTRRMAMALPIEGDRWLISLSGLNGEVPPTDPGDAVEYAASIGSPAIASLMENSEPLEEAATHRFVANQRRHVERMRRFPLGWVPVGDAVCSFNPIYGQGMTSAAQQAAELGRQLDRAAAINERFARRYFRAAGRVVSIPWSTAAGGDFAFDRTEGDKPRGTDMANRYMDRVLVAAQHDPAVLVRLQEVLAMVRPPSSLMGPAMMRRTLRGSRLGPTGVGSQLVRS